MSSLKKKAQVIMLPTKHSNLSLYENKLSLAKGNHNGIPDKMIPQHLFIVDDSEIKEGDYGIGFAEGIKGVGRGHYLFYHDGSSKAKLNVIAEGSKKVIASTDKSLKLPSPSEQFVQKYVESYNKGCEISEINIDYQEYFMSNVGDKFTVNKDLYGLSKGTSLTIKSFNFKNDPDLIEYEEDNIHNQGIHISHTNIKTEFVLKVDSKNLVTITRCKDSWDREEVTTILKAYHHHTQLIRKFKLGNSLDLNDWIRENL